MITNTYDSAFEIYQSITPEKQKIASIIKHYVDIRPEHKVLDIGSAQGVVVKMVQPNLENITMLDIIEQDVSPCNYIKRPLEEVKIEEIQGKYNLVIASHLWGHLYHNKSETESVYKILSAVKDGGHAVIISNTNSGFFGELGRYIKSILPDSQINQFEDRLIEPHHTTISSLKRCYFNTILETKTMDELTDMCRVFFVNEDDDYTKKRPLIKEFLESRLYYPELIIEQKAIILEKKNE